MATARRARALLIDLEGTVYEAGRLLPGVREALVDLASRGIPHGFVTNTTSRPRSALVAELVGMGLEIDPERIFTAPRAARRHLISGGLVRCHLLVRPSVLEDFSGIEASEERPQAVVVGDLGEEFTFERLNRAFRSVLDGAQLLTLARNRYYRGPGGLTLDVGAFTAALEYAAGRPATLLGKPSPEFFHAAIQALGVSPAETAVVGDDLESDVRGAQAAGLGGILVRSGKFRAADLDSAGSAPDAVLDSLAEIARVI
jgi:HAD superfamily hydrolase (TIGR01458 family)